MFQGKRARIVGPSPEPPPMPLIGAVPVPRMDNIAAHTARAWTALRVPMLPTLEACLRPDAPFGLAEQPCFNFPLRGRRLVPPVPCLEAPARGREGGSFGKASPYRAGAQFGSFPAWSAVGRSVSRTWGTLAGVASVQPRSQVRLAPHPVAAFASRWRCGGFPL